VSAVDAAEGIRLASVHGRPGETYIITGGPQDNLSYGDFMKLVAEVARRHYNQRVPNRFFALPASLCSPLATIFRFLPVEGPLSEALIRSGAVTHRFSSNRAADELGYRPRISLEEAIRSCLDFYFQHIQGNS
jgi:nucleoside-diphosphate-sugar epimerase